MKKYEAKQKICPVMPAQASTTTLNISQSDGAQTHEIRNFPTWTSYGNRCVADGCMMWRKNPIDADDGYCGLAGFQNHAGAG